MLGGSLVCAFATIGDVLKARGLAALVGAAPSVAVASLVVSAKSQGSLVAAADAKAMMIGAVALLVYANVCLYLMSISATRISISMLRHASRTFR